MYFPPGNGTRIKSSFFSTGPPRKSFGRLKASKVMALDSRLESHSGSSISRTEEYLVNASMYASSPSSSDSDSS